MSEEMVSYYALRATEYERVYTTPAWQDDLSQLQRIVPTFFAGRRVFEVACGTGYWTQYAAQRAGSVHATDVNDDTIKIARTKAYEGGSVEFERRDAYAMASEPGQFDAGLAAFWLSHVDLGRMDQFLRGFHSHLQPGAPVLMFDERHNDMRPLPTSRMDEMGNRYEIRTLASGERFEIVKNLFYGERLTRLIGKHGERVSYRELRFFWVLEYVVGP